jgi:hypothetical protein
LRRIHYDAAASRVGALMQRRAIADEDALS